MDANAESFFLAAVSPEFRNDPYPLYEQMRNESPVLQLADGQWFVFGHEPVSRLLRDPSFSSDERRSNFYADRQVDNPRWVERAEAPNLLFMDPPNHTRLRKLVSRAFTSATVEHVRSFTVDLASQHLDAIADAFDKGPVDVIEVLVHPIPVAVIGRILGVPTEDLPMFKTWSSAVARSVDPGFLRNESVDVAIDEASLALKTYIDELAESRRRAPGDDLLSALLAVESEDGDRLTRIELLELVQLLLIAGHETTVNLIGNAIIALARHTEARNKLIAQPHLIPASVDEFMRYDSPIQLTQRIATQPAEIAGALINPGDQVVLLLGSANRDPSVFSEPHLLQIQRDAKRQVGFGGGIHHCLGAPLARMEFAVVLECLLDHFPDYVLAEPPTYRAGFTLRGPENLLLGLRAN